MNQYSDIDNTGKVEHRSEEHGGDETISRRIPERQEQDEPETAVWQILCEDGDDDDESPDASPIKSASPDSEMDADDYHNKAVDYARCQRFHKAIQVCRKGLAIFPDDVDLLADIIKYSTECGDRECARGYYDLLNHRIPRSRFNWRAFTFSLDYLMKDPQKNETLCRQLLEDFQRLIPYDERCYIASCDLETTLGNYQRAFEVLQEAITELPNASVCSLKLADMQLERGLYEDVIRTVNYGLVASAEAKLSINVPYLYYLRALSSDALLHRRAAAGDNLDQEEIRRLILEYKTMSDLFPELERYSCSIDMRQKMLYFLEQFAA